MRTRERGAPTARCRFPRAAALAVVALVAATAARAQAVPGGAPARTVAATAGTAALDGYITDSLGTPLFAAVVEVESADRAVTTDSAGYFRLGELGSDTVEFTARRIGFAPSYFSIAMPPNATVHVAIKLRRSAVRLGTVMVEGMALDSRLRRSGFYDRQRTGRGYQLDPSFIEARRNLMNVSSVLREVPRVRVQCGRGAFGCIPRLGAGAFSCVPLLWLDRHPMDMAADGIDALVDMRSVVAVEVYRGAETPPQFASSRNACGAVVVWTDSPGAR